MSVQTVDRDLYERLNVEPSATDHAVIARQDPDYLEWLERHSSGPRYLQDIERVLAQRGHAKATSSRFKERARRR